MNRDKRAQPPARPEQGGGHPDFFALSASGGPDGRGPGTRAAPSERDGPGLRRRAGDNDPAGRGPAAGGKRRSRGAERLPQKGGRPCPEKSGDPGRMFRAAETPKKSPGRGGAGNRKRAGRRDPPPGPPGLYRSDHSYRLQSGARFRSVQLS